MEGKFQRVANRGKGKQWREEEGLTEGVKQVRLEHPSQNWAQDQSVQTRKNNEDPWESRKLTRESCMNNKLTNWKAKENPVSWPLRGYCQVHYHQQVKSSRAEKQVPNHGLGVTPPSRSQGQQCAEPYRRLKRTSVCVSRRCSGDPWRNERVVTAGDVLRVTWWGEDGS